jgi:hypothetical protein
MTEKTNMRVSPPQHGSVLGRGLTRSRMAVAISLTAALAVLAGPTASAHLPVERSPHKTSVYKVRFDQHLFGVHDYFAHSLHRKGTGSIRLWDAGVTWSALFPTQATPDWTRLDSLVRQAHANGTEVTLVLGLTPAFAAADPTDPDYAKTTPDLGMYTEYVHEVMSRYSPANWGYRGIAAYQVWNEANIATFWKGTLGELGQLTKAVHDVRNQVDKGALVVGPAMVIRMGYQQRGMRQFYDTVVDGRPVWKYVDAISLNLYPLDTYPAGSGTRMGTPEDSMAILATARSLLAKDQVPPTKPIWNTEVNYGMRAGKYGGTPAVPIATRRQVAYVFRTYLLNAAQGVKRVDWYAYDMGSLPGGGTLGNTHMTDPTDRAAGTLLPAGRAFTRVQAWMRGGTLVGTTTKRPCITDRKGTYTCLIRYANGVGRVYWNPYHGARVRLVKSATKKINEYGTTTRAHGGTRLKISYMPVLVKSKR